MYDELEGYLFTNFIKMKETEGKKIYEDLSSRIEDIQSFINSWASSSMQRTDELESMLSETGIGKEEGVKHGK